MAVRQREQPRRPAAQLAEQTPLRPARAGVDEHILDEVDVDQVAGAASELTDAGGNLVHGARKKAGGAGPKTHATGSQGEAPIAVGVRRVSAAQSRQADEREQMNRR